MKERQNEFDEHFRRVEVLYCTPGSAATGLAPNGIYSYCLSCLPTVILELGHLAGNQSLECHRLAHRNMVKDHERCAYELVSERHALTVSHLALPDAKFLNLSQMRPRYTIGDWVWMCNVEATLRQGSSKCTHGSLSTSKLS